MPVKRARLLIIDDDTDCLNDMVLMLEPEFQTDVASSSQVGYDKYAAIRPDAIILDLEMPLEFAHPGEIEGIALLKLIRSESDIPIFVVSAGESESCRTQSLTAGANEFFSKPCDIKKLVALLNRQLGF